jgi:hypothetical protein
MAFAGQAPGAASDPDTRSMYQTPDIAVQGQLLNEVAALIEAGKRGCKSSTG